MRLNRLRKWCVKCRQQGSFNDVEIAGANSQYCPCHLWVPNACHEVHPKSAPDPVMVLKVLANREPIQKWKELLQSFERNQEIHDWVGPFACLMHLSRRDSVDRQLATGTGMKNERGRLLMTPVLLHHSPGAQTRHHTSTNPPPPHPVSYKVVCWNWFPSDAGDDTNKNQNSSLTTASLDILYICLALAWFNSLFIGKVHAADHSLGLQIGWFVHPDSWLTSSLFCNDSVR